MTNDDVPDTTTPNPNARPPAVFDEAFLTDVPGVTELILVRHGQQVVPEEGSLVGELTDPPLSDHGRVQAQCVGEALSTTNFSAVYSSPLARALQTAQAIAKHHRLEPIVVQDLREVEIFRDLPRDKRILEVVDVDLLRAARRRMLNERSWDVYPFSESSAQFRKRAINAIEMIVARTEGERVAIVCHGGVINAYMSHIIDSPYDMFFRPAHASINIAVAGRNRRVLRSLNDVHHLLTAEGDLNTY